MSANAEKLPLTIVTHEFFPMNGGIATFVEEMAGACHDLGQNVEVWAPSRPTPHDRSFRFPVRRISVRGTQDLSCQVRMARELITSRRHLRRRIVYLPEPGPLLAMTYLHFFSAFKPARLVLTFHGSEVQSFSSRPTARLLVRRLIRAADRVTTTSHFTRELLCSRFPDASRKVVMTPCALRTEFVDRETSRMKTTNKVIILTVGRLHPRKGQHVMIDALNRLPDDVAKKAEYWVVGRSVRGNYEAQLRQRAASSKVPVVFLGNIAHDELDVLYRRADIFAMTSLNHGRSVEGFGLVYLEASAFGLPVVGHAVGGVPEAVSQGETGLLIKPNDSDGLVAALESLIVDRELRESMGEAGRIWARQTSWHDSARNLLSGLVVNGSKTRRPAHAFQPA